ncbi:MAG TPA: response regulator [Gemmatimonadales bacterium]|nr:response regulator [Gemmatimonadales bacterium]
MTNHEVPAEILVVDDNPAMVRLLAEVLEDEGYRVATVEGGEVVELALAAPPRLILLDVMMPGLDGPEVCRRLRADPRTQAVPIVLVTALPPATLAVQLRGCPYDELLPKPFAIEAVLAIAERYAGPPMTPA